jgi:hypothetical protein
VCNRIDLATAGSGQVSCHIYNDVYIPSKCEEEIVVRHTPVVVVKFIDTEVLEFQPGGPVQPAWHSRLHLIAAAAENCPGAH